jgi:hypothetical protein
VNTRSIRLGLLIDSHVQPAWIEQMLAETLALPFVRLELVVENAAPPDPPTSRVRNWWKNRNHLVFAAFMRLDRRKHHDPATSPHTPRDISQLLHGAPTIRVVPQRDRFHDAIKDDDVAQIQLRELDVVLRLGFRILRGSILHSARYGVWSYHHGDSGMQRGGPAGVWEVLESQASTGAILQVLGPELDGGKVIYRAHTATVRGSVTRNQSAYYWKTATFVPRKLRELHEFGDQAVAPLDRIQPYTRRLYTMPRNGEMIRLWLRHSWQRGRRKLDQLIRRQQWYIAYRFDEHGGAPNLTFHRFRALYPPSDRIWADPFVLQRDGRYYIFLEEKMFSQFRGHIAVIELTRDGVASDATPVLTLPHHLSYPCVFTWGGDTYLLPESHDAGALTLYRARSFPMEWEPVMQVLNDNVVDPTMAEIDGRWWLFATRRSAPGLDCDELYAYWSTSPLGPWTPHRRNPLKSDIRSARSAGRLFQRDGEWYRPAQDGASRYGSSIRLMRLHMLTESDFAEVEVAALAPEWDSGLHGMHTINGDGALTVIDLRRSIWRRGYGTRRR